MRTISFMPYSEETPTSPCLECLIRIWVATSIASVVCELESHKAKKLCSHHAYMDISDLRLLRAFPML